MQQNDNWKLMFQTYPLLTEETQQKLISILEKMKTKGYLIYVHLVIFEQQYRLRIEICHEYINKTYRITTFDDDMLLKHIIKQQYQSEFFEYITLSSLEEDIKREIGISQRLITMYNKLSEENIKIFEAQCTGEFKKPYLFPKYKQIKLEILFKQYLKLIERNELTKEEVIQWLQLNSYDTKINKGRVYTIQILKSFSTMIEKPKNQKLTKSSTRSKKRYQEGLLDKILLNNFPNETFDKSAYLRKIDDSYRQFKLDDNILEYLFKEINYMKENVDASFSLFKQHIITLKQLEQNLQKYASLNRKNIMRLLEYDLNLEECKNSFINWKNGDIITEEEFGQLIDHCTGD